MSEEAGPGWLVKKLREWKAPEDAEKFRRLALGSFAVDEETRVIKPEWIEKCVRDDITEPVLLYQSTQEQKAIEAEFIAAKREIDQRIRCAMLGWPYIIPMHPDAFLLPPDTPLSDASRGPAQSRTSTGPACEDGTM